MPRLPRLTVPEFSQRWSSVDKLPEFTRRLVDRTQRNNDEIRETANQNDAISASKMRQWFFGLPTD